MYVKIGRFFRGPAYRVYKAGEAGRESIEKNAKRSGILRDNPLSRNERFRLRFLYFFGTSLFDFQELRRYFDYTTVGGLNAPGVVSPNYLCNEISK